MYMFTIIVYIFNRTIVAAVFQFQTSRRVAELTSSRALDLKNPDLNQQSYILAIDGPNVVTITNNTNIQRLILAQFVKLTTFETL